MDKVQLLEYLFILNEKLRQRGILGEIALYGGIVMCLALNARDATHDIDAIFEPKRDIAVAIKEISKEYNLDDGWLNDGVKGFTSKNNDLIPFQKLSNLNIYAASPLYMFAMKCLSCRMTNKTEIEDIKFLIKYLNIRSVAQAEEILYAYYPKNRILPKTFYMLMELLGEWNAVHNKGSNWIYSKKY